MRRTQKSQAEGLPDSIVGDALTVAHSAIERRAYELYEARGETHGHDWEDWFEAEHELRDQELLRRVDAATARLKARRRPPATTGVVPAAPRSNSTQSIETS